MAGSKITSDLIPGHGQKQVEPRPVESAKPGRADAPPAADKHQPAGDGPKSQNLKTNERDAGARTGEHKSMLLGDLARQRDHVLKNLQDGGRRTERDRARTNDDSAASQRQRGSRAERGGDKDSRAERTLEHERSRGNERDSRAERDGSENRAAGRKDDSDRRSRRGDEVDGDRTRGRGDEARLDRSREQGDDSRAQGRRGGGDDVEYTRRGERERSMQGRSADKDKIEGQRSEDNESARRHDSRRNDLVGNLTDRVRDLRRSLLPGDAGEGRRGHGSREGGDGNRTHGRERGLDSTAGEALKLLRDGRLRDGDLKHLPSDLRKALKSLSETMGRDAVGRLVVRGGHRLEKFAERLYRNAGDGGREAPGRTVDVGRREAAQRANELAGALKLVKHFERLERTGGEPVRRAEATAWRLLTRETEHYGGGLGSQAARRFGAAELLRDLRTGAFLPERELRNPFPLTGRARVVSEMMELARALDRIDRFAQRGGGVGGAAAGVVGDGDGAGLSTLGRAAGGGAFDAVMDDLLANFPALPGRAARVEIQRLLAALQGPLADAAGRVLVTRDGIPLKAGELLWLGVAGGLPGSLPGVEHSAARLSAALASGFDAVYSLIGFDGRTLNAPHFAAVQAQVNASDLDWVFGQPPLSEGWTRAVIERLKDSALADHNLLGEMLEEALADGRFHAALVGGAVEEGAAVPDSFAVTRLLPGPSADALAFEPA